MDDLADVADELAAEGIAIAGISVDPVTDSAALAERLDIGFPLLSDPEAEVIDRYGVRMKGETLAVPATFIVRRDGTIAWRYVGERALDRPPLSRVRQEATR